MKKTLLMLTAFLTLSFVSATNVEAKDAPSLIPYPTKLEMKEGQFNLTTKTQLKVNDQGKFANEIFYLQSLIQPVLGQYLSPSTGDNVLEINYSDKVTNAEGYIMDITADKVSISAKTAAGAFYAIQTIRQMLPVEVETGKKANSAINFPALSIVDYPAYEWRGTMADVSRHMFTLEYLKKHIDRLSLYKMNKLHLHLTDDQGWRIEIKKYPKLTQNGAWRTYNNHDKECIKKSTENPDFAIDPRFIIQKDGQEDVYGGYFTQDQIKELVKYAQSKHVELIPEIDMPGHMAAVVATYPFVTDGHSGWGKQFSIPLNPAKDSTYIFVQDVLTEIMDLFPTQYVHVGADEVEKTTWQESKLCQDLMKKEGLKSVEELQSYFLHRIQDFVESKGKKLIAWDEALEGGINSNVNIMYWRGWEAKAPLKAVMNGNSVIMSPNNPVYFDYLPDKSSLNNVYHMDVIYDDIPKEKEHLIKGAQANLWAEMIPTENRADFLMFPRVTALAERLWTNQELFGSYSDRILSHYPRLDALGVNYRLPDVDRFAMESVYIKETYFDLKSPLSDMTIRYTLDGSIPAMDSQALDKPYKINKPTQVKFALFSPGGVRGEIYTVNYKASQMHKAQKLNAKNMKAGLACDFYKGYFAKGTKDIKGTPDENLIATNLAAPKEAKAPQFGLKFNGYINVPENGTYSFFFTCDDGGVLYLNNEVVVDNDGLHSPVEKSGQIALAKGLHPINLDFVEGGGGFTLRVQYSFNNGEVKDIPDSWFVH